MADKKREKYSKTQRYIRSMTGTEMPQTFDDEVDRITRQTLDSVIRAETYPKGESWEEDDEDVQIYHSRRESERYEEDPYTVAQHMKDRTQFRH